MFLRCLEHERIMFGMFSTCFEPRNTCRSHLAAIFVDFQHQYVKIDFFKLKKCFLTHVIQNTLCRFLCVCRMITRQRALNSPDIGLCFEYLHHGCWRLRKFFTNPQRSGTHFFGKVSGPNRQNLIFVPLWVRKIFSKPPTYMM